MKFFTCPILIAVLVSGSQRNPAEAVAEAELAFAKTSRETNTVMAFVSNLAPDAIMFRQGEPVDGLSLWEKRTPDSTLLNWWPVVADAAMAGDLGYTTGPYQFFNKRTDSNPIGNGYYSTIWQKQKDGSWKIKVDLGVRLEKIQELPTQLIYAPVQKADKNSSASISAFDKEYNRTLNVRAVSFDPESFAKNFRIHRPLIGPKINASADVELAEKGKKFRFEFLGGEESASHDLAYTYGKVIRTEKDGEHKCNYLRVWKNEGNNWKIVLDVVTEG